jgi:sugar phosphate isomerase/epimerase
MTRRVFLAALTSTGSGSPSKSMMAVEGYIFQQHAQSLKQPLEAVIPNALRMVRAAGFRNLELNTAFFPLDGRARTLSLIRSYGFQMPSLYVGGAMHEEEKADQTISKALEYGNVCRPFGCNAIVNNPDPKPNDAPKTEAELAIQAESLNRMGRRLAGNGFQLRVHHHTPQLENNAREWRHILQHTDPEYVHICVDVDWAYEGGFEPISFLREAGSRLREIHVRSARNKVWLEDLEDSDIDYHKVADYLGEHALNPLIVVELAYRSNTIITRSLEEDLRRSRLYAEKVFRVRADA